MRTISYNTIVDTVKQLCIDSCYILPQDVYDAIDKSIKTETNARARNILNQLIDNADIAREERIPICQDTGLTIVFVEQGSKCGFEPPSSDSEATITDAINEGVKQGYSDGLLRKSLVSEPLNQRLNTQTNTPSIIHHSIVRGDHIKISVMCKGGGCENKSQFKMFNPTASKEEVMEWVVGVVDQAGANACPPFVIGVGIGGDFEQCCLNSKKALLKKLGEKNPDPFYAEMEDDLLESINKCGFGPQGFGGDTSALGVMIETAGCHIASLPVAVNIECHAHRHKTAIL
ncbi:MAG: fumarate hydratase [Sedimentisphaeraceae bacterium JB056]